ncbi:putative APC5 protein [Cercophora newfieldiana]|uniref:Anaphase-promoting complex subunit 5 n=1 Tax=Cercophora newfieldiana TaxID=92897 RepID=A0AA39YPQ8_9PEZI|nr:putative APC5 protein [Cercophora newfieldiana]
MSRILTPARIGFLALIQLYAEGAVPNDAIVPVINFVTSHVFDCDLTTPATTSTYPATATTSTPPAAGTWAKAESAISVILSLREFERVLGPFAAADRLPGRRLWDRFLEKLWAIDTLHALQEFFDRLPSYLAKTREELRRHRAEHGDAPPRYPHPGIQLSRASPFGGFLRNANLEFLRLRFDTAADLWKAFVKYRQPTADYWRRRNPHYGRLSFDSVLVAAEPQWGGDNTDALAVLAYGHMLYDTDYDDASPVSTHDIEALLEFQVEKLHRFGNRVPSELGEQFNALLKQSHAIPSLFHYVSFSDTWRAGDYFTTFDNLHRYFDYTMQYQNKPFHQYALMNMAIVQSDFGCHREAIAMMLATVSTAREARDTTCLNFALNWLFHFGRAHPKLVRELERSSGLSSEKEILAFLRAKARETGMWVLWSSALLGEARLGLSSGESISAALENMVRSSQIIVERNMKPMMGTQLSVATTLWDRLGLAYMSTLACEVFLRCHAKNSIFDDELKATGHLAGLLAAQGKYEQAFATLEQIDKNSLRLAKASECWHLFRGIVKLRRDLHHNNLDAADHLLSQLLQAEPDTLEPEGVFLIDSMHIEALMRRGDFDAAFAKIDRLLAELREDDGDIALRVRLLIHKAHLFDCVGRPEKGFTLSVRAASLAWRARLLPQLWHAIGALANILNALAEFAAAAQLLVAVLPRCLESDDVFVAATLYSLLADAWTGQAGEVDAKTQKQKRTECMTKAHEALDSALAYFATVEDVEKQCEMLAKQATLMRAMGDHVRSEEYAAKYLALKKESMARNE